MSADPETQSGHPAPATPARVSGEATVAEPVGSGVGSGLPTKVSNRMASVSGGTGLPLCPARALLTCKHGKFRLLPVLKHDLGVLSDAEEGPAPMSGAGWRA